MLPTTGYFKDIECPFFDNQCGRPYCHFRHRKKVADQSDSPKQISTEGSDVPTYNPTPKSQLANPRTQSHIPIRYVPDLANLSNRSRKMSTENLPTYRPTPLSMLPSFNRTGNSATSENTQAESTESSNSLCSNLLLDYPNVEYNPNELLKADCINFEELSTEFDMIDDIINECDEEKTEELPVENDGQNLSHSEQDHSKHTHKRRLSSGNVNDTPASSTKKHRKTKSPEKASNTEESSITKSDKDSKKEKNSKSSDKHKSHTSRHADKEKHKSQSSSHKEKDKDRHRSKHKEKKSDEKSNKHKEKEKSKHKNTETHEKKTEKHSSSSSKHVKKKDEKHRSRSDKKSKVIKEEINDVGDSLDNDFVNSDVDFDSEDETLEECYKIFTEYKPEEPKLELETKTTERKSTEENNLEEASSVGKKRVAHERAERIVKNNPPARPKPVANPALTMTNRFKAARLAQANNEQNALIEALLEDLTQKPSSSTTNKHDTTKKKPALSKIESKAQINNRSSQSVSLVDDIISGSSKPRRIAPVQNVNSLQRAKAKIDELARQKAAAITKKTLARTVSNGGSRVAHIPEFSLSELPDVLEAEKSKLPVNVRTRYLTMIADECGKLYLTKGDAYQRALNEEFKCYERCKVLTTYRNSAMLSVNRLRKEALERARKGLDPMSSLDACKSNEVSELKGKKFYENIKCYILTEEELVLHGYPRESSIPGIAMFPNKKSTKSLSLKENERICARCSKIYLVDDEGLALYEQECIYHPLKKRTFRGESSYLCCKSSDDTGCVTSNTHVCEQTIESEMEGFQTTMEPESDNDSRSYAVYALDCEMCYTTKGLELTRVTIVDVDCKTVYESLVKPLNMIIDYNTRFSGITKEQMDKTSTSILQVQANILHLCNSKTILIGHSLESDMKALKIVHNSIIDTSVLFPHKLGLPHKRALRNLASEYLKKIIQNDVAGHDSAEDALACMELVIWKVKEDLKVRGIKV